jgi:hypothetical protein
MKIISLLVALAAVTLMTGCGPTLSLHPLYTDKDLASDLPLEGKWADAEGDEVWTIHKSGDGFEGASPSTSDPEKVGIHVVRLGELRFLDITSKDTSSLDIPGHLFAKVWMVGEELRVQALDSDWVKQKIRETGFPHVEMEDEQVILTAPTPELQKFVALYANEPKAFESDVGKFHRVRSTP